MAEVLAKSVAGLTAKDVLEAYYAIPGWQRRRMCWVMSSETADVLWVLFREAHETSLPLASRPGGDFTLVGRPVRIDEGAEGLAYGQLDDEPEPEPVQVWVCDPPALGVRFRVVREEWSEDDTRRILEIEVVE